MFSLGTGKKITELSYFALLVVVELLQEAEGTSALTMSFNNLHPSPMEPDHF